MSPATKNGGHWPRRCSATAPRRAPPWGVGKWNQGLLAMWRGYVETGKPGRDVRRGPCRSLGFLPVVGGRHPGHHIRPLAPGATAEVTFLLGWHFPNRRSWLWGGGAARAGWPARCAMLTPPGLRRCLGGPGGLRRLACPN